MTSASPIFHHIDEKKSSLRWIAERVGLTIDEKTAEKRILGLSSAKAPKTDTLSFVQSPKGIAFDGLKIVTCVLCSEKTAKLLPEGPVQFIVDNPHLAFAEIAAEFYPQSLGSQSINNAAGVFVSPDAVLENSVIIEAGAVIGAGVCIGAGSVIGANATIAPNCQIGRNCTIGASTNIQYALIGDNVIIHPGAQIGQDGFGFVPSAKGLLKMPQLGRVIIQNDVEIGANSTIDRGALEDTIIGEATKIDNLVQIAHNVVIGRNCAIAAFVGISGSSQIGDGCMLGGRSAISDHVKLGNGVQLAATSSVMNDIPDGEKWAGTPAQPFKAFFREQATLRRLVKTNKTNSQ